NPASVFSPCLVASEMFIRDIFFVAADYHSCSHRRYFHKLKQLTQPGQLNQILSMKFLLVP
ncbi:hypothetical protein, partial [Rodentibacter pneumotropicus]|uniref:hypothetical protein n=1 Tax=Rodentibacter pneumotropicus TaxID=758 RepID=UPI001EE2F28D